MMVMENIIIKFTGITSSLLVGWVGVEVFSLENAKEGVKPMAGTTHRLFKKLRLFISFPLQKTFLNIKLSFYIIF